VAVSVDVCAVVLLIVTDVGKRPHVVGLVAPDGDDVTEQVSATAPVNELDGVTVIVAVPLDPGLTLRLPLFERVKLLLLGASQKPLHPASPVVTASSSHPHIPTLIAAPLLSSAEFTYCFRCTIQFKGIASALVLSHLPGQMRADRTSLLSRETQPRENSLGARKAFLRDLQNFSRS
jgi:hypothetical protein